MEEVRDEDSSASASNKEVFRIAKVEYEKGALVFGLYKDRGFPEDRWYLARVVGADVTRRKFSVKWCEDKVTELLPPHFLLSQAEVIQPGMEVNILPKKKKLYDVAIVDRFSPDGRHLFRNIRGSPLKVSFPLDSLMVKAPVLDAFRRQKKNAEKLSKTGTSTPRTSPVKRPIKEEEEEPRNGFKRLSREGRSVHEGIKTEEDGSESQTTSSIVADSHSESEICPSTDTNFQTENEQKVDTSVDNAEPEITARAPGQKLLHGWTFLFSEGASGDETFVRSSTAKDIHDLGGKVCTSFDVLNRVEGEKALIAPCPNRTAKFFQCLAADIPCVSYKWIGRIVKDGKMSPYQPFRLPTGRSSITGESIEWKPRDKNLLKGMRFGFYAVSSMDSVWEPIMQAAEARTIVLEYRNFLSGKLTTDDKEDLRIDVLLLEDDCPPELAEAAQNTKTPLCDTEWVLESLVQGVRQHLVPVP